MCRLVQVLWLICCVCSFGASKECPQHMFLWKNKKTLTLILSYLELLNLSVRIYMYNVYIWHWQIIRFANRNIVTHGTLSGNNTNEYSTLRSSCVIRKCDFRAYLNSRNPDQPGKLHNLLTHCSLNELSHTLYWKILISILGMSGYVI